jgi:DegV family protein with EDD domain
MSYKIVGDSCCDFTKEELEQNLFTQVPLVLYADGQEFMDDETFDQKVFLEAALRSKEVPRSACPTPENYMEAYDGADDIYVITLTKKLSGSYNSAVLAKNLYAEEKSGKNIHVFDSKAAASAQHLIARKIDEYASAGMPFEQVVEKVEAYIDGMNVLFVLETLDVLEKNGRLSKVSALIANTLHIKPLMTAVDGEIEKVSQTRGIKKALKKLVDEAVSRVKNPEECILSITHCNCLERAMELKDELMSRIPFKEAEIIDARGVSTLYACDGGVIVSF